MPIYKISENTAIQLPFNRDGFGNEFKLRDFFAENLETLLGVRFIEKEYPTDGGRMDTIGIDENNSPVIIEYKWKENEEVFSQGLFYLDWLKRNKRHFELLVSKKFGKDIDVNWSSPRVILIAQGFSRYVKSAVQQVDGVELKTYAIYSDGIIHIENEYGGSNKSVRREAKADSCETLQPSNTETTTEYDLDFYFGNLSTDLKETASSLRDKILGLPSVEEIMYKIGITYRTTRSFVRFEFRKDWIMVLVREAKYSEDSSGIVEDISAHKWGYSGKIKLTANSDIEYIFNIIQASYSSTL